MKCLIYIVVIFPLCVFSQSWTVQVITEIDGWGLGGDNIVYDIENYLGVDISATDEYDNIFDIPEPPTIGNYIKFYFPHPDWDSPFEGDLFTQDIRFENGSLLNETGITWDAFVYSNMDGESSLTFILEGVIPDCQINFTIDDAEFELNDGDVIYTYLNAYVEKPVAINVGNCDYPLSISNPQPNSPLLINAYPNPFNNAVNIEYFLLEPGIVSIQIFDLHGHSIPIGIDRRVFQQAGHHILKWQAALEVSGLYIITIESVESKDSKRVLLLK